MQLGQRQGGGGTLREHLHAAAQSTGTVDPMLTELQVPAGCTALWAAFVDLSMARPSGMGPSAIPPSEVLAWQQLHGLRLTSWELDTLAAMDRAGLAISAAAASSNASNFGRY